MKKRERKEERNGNKGKKTREVERQDGVKGRVEWQYSRVKERNENSWKNECGVSENHVDTIEKLGNFKRYESDRDSREKGFWTLQEGS